MNKHKIALFALISLGLIGCQPRKPAPLTAEQYDQVRKMTDEAFAPGLPDEALRHETVDAIIEIHKRNQWFRAMPMSLKASLGECFQTRFVRESRASISDMAPDALRQRTAVIGSYYDAIGARKFKDFDPYCPEIIEQVGTYVP